MTLSAKQRRTGRSARRGKAVVATMRIQVQRHDGARFCWRNARRTGRLTPTTPLRRPSCRSGGSCVVGEWPNRDPVNELGFNLLIQSQNPFNLDEEKHLYGFVLNNPVNLVDADGRVPVVAIFFYGNAIGNAGIACYSCKKLNDCLETARDYTQLAGENMEPENFQRWLRAAKPGSECTLLMKDCGVRVISATFWVAGRLLILKYLAK